MNVWSPLGGMFAEHLVFSCDILHLSLSETDDKTVLNEHTLKPVTAFLKQISFYNKKYSPPQVYQWLSKETEQLCTVKYTQLFERCFEQNLLLTQL